MRLLNHRAIRLTRLTLLAGACLIAHVAHTAAIEVTLEMAEGDQVRGTLVDVKEGRINLTEADTNRALHIRIPDVSSITLAEGAADVSNDAKIASEWVIGTTTVPSMPQSVARNVRLQAGYHRMMVLTANNGPVPRIDLRVNGGGVSLRPIPADWLAHAPDDAKLAPPREDSSGMRLATTVVDAKPMLAYRIYERPEMAWKDARELLNSDPSSTGFAELVDSAVGEFEADNLAGIVFDGLINVPRDDTYTFSLQSTGAATLMIDTVTTVANIERWSVNLRDGATLTGQVRGWDESAITLGLAADSSLSIPVSEIVAAWPSAAEGLGMPPELAGRDDGGEDLAVVSNEGKIVRVKGVIKGRDGDMLSFKHDGKDRKLALDKLKGVRFAASQKPMAPVTHRVTFINGDTLNATVATIDNDAASFSLPWGGQVKVPTNRIASITVLNGRRVYLSDLHPSHVEEAPYFSRTMHYRRDLSLSGQPLRLVSEGPIVRRGLAVHAYSALTYDLEGKFTSLRTAVGFQQPEGRRGRAALRIEGDGKVLWSQADMRGSDKPIDVSLNITGVRHLTLIADFGEEQDVGDRIVWGDAHVIRKETGR